MNSSYGKAIRAFMLSVVKNNNYELYERFFYLR